MAQTTCLEDILLRSRNRFRAIVDAVPDAMCVLDRDLTVASANLAFAQWESKSPREIIGCQPHFPLSPDVFLACLGGIVRQVFRSHKTTSQTCRIDSQFGEPAFLEITVSPLPREEGEEAYVVAVTRDVTRQKQLEIEVQSHADRLEGEVREKTADLRRTISQLRQAESSRRDLFNMIVHDLKSPLAQVMANLDLMDNGVLDEELQQFLEAARIGGDDMALMIGNLLDVERMQDQRTRLVFEPTDPSAIVERVVERLQVHAAIHGVRIDQELSGEMPPLVLDRSFFERILRNLLMNAIEYSPEGTAILVGLSFDTQRACMLLSVQDEGPGIPQEQRAIIFEKFRQAKGQERAGSGAGLGLAFCKMAVQAHHGTIEALDGSNGKGTRFLVTIPLLGLKGEKI